MALTLSASPGCKL